ncbi:unnamed protein product [Trifolium pratense]|uniref:Uncharacterized protein n=1 Tax=Trifolium pratense TaxID=57577 RepID=A0ACB0JJZ4_TRIPR|nr:unnamed protein product [Trifolium pratense]
MLGRNIILQNFPLVELTISYDASCEEGTATSLCRALDKIADVSVPGSMAILLFKGSAAPQAEEDQFSAIGATKA